MIKIKIILIVFLNFFLCNLSLAKFEIIFKVNDNIVTNFDLEKEINYLEILDTDVKKLSNSQKSLLAKNSLIKDIIKENEIKRFANFKIDNSIIDEYLSNFFLRLGYKTKEEFSNILKSETNYSLQEIENKIKIELIWNDFIYSKFINQVKVNESKIINKVNLLKDTIEKEYFLSEIVFKKNKDKPLSEIFDEIKLSINEIGFANTANIYSYADSSKFGGKIGWVSEIGLSKKLNDNIKNLKIGELSDFIKIGNNYLILKVLNLRQNKKVIDKKKEIQYLIEKEKNDQLNKFSKIYFEKIQMNYLVNEK